MGQRGYNPDNGRFDSTDPVFQGSANTYDYVDQSPLAGSDLTGTFRYKVHFHHSEGPAEVIDGLANGW